MPVEKMTAKTEKVEVPAWAFADGQPKPEYRLTLKRPLPDGTLHLDLTEPNIKAVRRSTKLLVYEGEEPTNESGLACGIMLIATVTNLPEETVEELVRSDFTTALAYLQSFS